MAIQLIIKSKHVDLTKSALSDICEETELFAIDQEHTGLSVPTKAEDRIGESNFRSQISSIEHYDLWEGKWIEGKT